MSTPIRLLGAIAIAVAVTYTVPQHLCASPWEPIHRGDADAVDLLAEGVSDWLAADLTIESYQTGSARFDGEWLFGTSMMAAMGFGQLAIEQPPRRADALRSASRAIDRVLTADLQAFDRAAWGEGPLDTLEGGHGHAAWLGYLNLALSQHRLADPNSPYGPLNDRITAELARRLAEAPNGLVPTYPGEHYPVDNAAVVGSIGLYDRATGADHGALLARWSEGVRDRYVDPATGLLIQAAAADGTPIDAARGSGTLLASFFLSGADPALSRALWEAAHRELYGTILGFGMMREYPRGTLGWGDIDSGPVVLGYGVSATGFALAGARTWGDAETFTALGSTATLFGAPLDRSGTRHFVTGGPLGDAILFAMATAPKGET